SLTYLPPHFNPIYTPYLVCSKTKKNTQYLVRYHKNMAKFTTFFIIVALLLFSTLTYASARPISTSVYPEEISVEKLEQGEENCEGVGEEECVLIRRTLVAHTDYIYTQNHNHP
ncbi:unnamed protein product, partial [Brassica oleracea]|uniref:Phytosulfokine n=2 Tax=Brassica TaxID=3705 RepID=A0A0D3BEM0_BRAOL